MLFIWTLKYFKTVRKYSHSPGANWETEARRGKRLSPHLSMGILSHCHEIQTEPQVVRGDESSEWSPALEPCASTGKSSAWSGQDTSKMEIFPVKMIDGCFKRSKYHLGLVHWPEGSCALICSRIFKIGYKNLWEWRDHRKNEMCCGSDGLHGDFLELAFLFGFFLTRPTGTVCFSLFFVGACALLSLPHPCLVASCKMLSRHPSKRCQVSALHPLQWEPV